MAYNLPQIRISFLFRILNSDELAMTDLSLSGVPGPSTPVLSNETLDAIGALFRTFVTDDSNGFTRGDYSQLYGLKAAGLQTDGTYAYDAITRPISPLTGGGSNVLPQASVVLSLRSGSALGKGNYGRMFIPHSRLQQNAGAFGASETAAAAFAAKGATFITGVNSALDAGGSGLSVRIMGQTGGVGTAKEVTQVAVGRITDTQRRRRNALPEQYSFASV